MASRMCLEVSNKHGVVVCATDFFMITIQIVRSRSALESLGGVLHHSAANAEGQAM